MLVGFGAVVRLGADGNRRVNGRYAKYTNMLGKKARMKITRKIKLDVLVTGYGMRLMLNSFLVFSAFTVMRMTSAGYLLYSRYLRYDDVCHHHHVEKSALKEHRSSTPGWKTKYSFRELVMPVLLFDASCPLVLLISPH